MIHCTNVTISVHMSGNLGYTPIYSSKIEQLACFKTSKKNKKKVQLLVVSPKLVYWNNFGACHGAPNSSISRSKSLLVTSSRKGVRGDKTVYTTGPKAKSLHSIL